MALLALEHSKAAYRADFMTYGIAELTLAGFLAIAAPAAQRPALLALALTGLCAWTLIEYILHRFILHGVPPFSRWHGEHHRRPTALICTPTLLSATLIVVLVFVPALAFGNPWRAGALTLGVLSGYIAYTVTHHATHHWRFRSAWLLRRKRWHALHHHIGTPGCYGVTSNFWDHVFGTAGRIQSAIKDK